MFYIRSSFYYAYRTVHKNPCIKYYVVFIHLKDIVKLRTQDRYPTQLKNYLPTFYTGITLTIRLFIVGVLQTRQYYKKLTQYSILLLNKHFSI